MIEKLTGTWRLLSVESIRPSGEIIYPFYGRHPQGLLIYDRSGRMSVQIVSDPQPEMPGTDSSEGLLKAPVDAKIKALEGYYAYFGTWAV